MPVNNMVIIFGIALLITIYLSEPISLGVMAREQPFDQITWYSKNYWSISKMLPALYR